MIDFILRPGATQEILGLLPYFWAATDQRPAREQAHTAYAHGGGWRKFEGFVLRADGSLKYPGDPALQCLAIARLREETIRVYVGAWVAIVQPDGSYEVSRMD